MTDKFLNCIDFVLTHETEYDGAGNAVCENDPNDPGGRTKYGIDQRDHPHVDICALDEEGAAQIYFDNEWTKSRCEDLPDLWDLIVFDSSVNPGMGFSIRELQRVSGAKIDGFIGPLTIAAVQGIATNKDAMNTYLDAREGYYRSLPTSLKKHFLNGWLNRVSDLRDKIT